MKKLMIFNDCIIVYTIVSYISISVKTYPSQIYETLAGVSAALMFNLKICFCILYNFVKCTCAVNKHTAYIKNLTI